MDTPSFLALVLACAPQIAPSTAQALATVESALNPWAIGVVGGRLERQPRSRAEALATARALRAAGWNFSVGLGQINLGNFERLGLSLDTAFEPCTNLAAMQTVLTECLERSHASRAAHAYMTSQPSQTSLRKTLSCYYSGNFVTGFEHGYVRKVIAAARLTGSARAPLPQAIAQPKEQP